MFCVPRGYHGPCIAAPGYPMYYLNVLAGPGGERSMAFCDDPAHHWVRDTWAEHGDRPAVSDDDEGRTDGVTTLGIGVIGFGWMGQAHSRGCRRAPSYFLDRDYEPELVVVGDTVEARRDDAVRVVRVRGRSTDWHEVVEPTRRRRRRSSPRPNMLHVEMVEAAAGGRQARVLREAGRRHAARRPLPPSAPRAAPA